MFTENEIKAFLKAKAERKSTGFLFVFFGVSCLSCAWLGFEVLDIPSDTMLIIGTFISLYAGSYFTSAIGSGRLIALMEKAVNSDPEAIKILARLKNR